MKVICVDDERLLMEDTVGRCREVDHVEATGFTHPADAISYLSREHADVALLDIDMPGMNGIELARKLREICPPLQVIFLTGYPQYALDAYEVHPCSYLIKPVKKDRLEAELAFASSIVLRRQPVPVEARTFGNFDLFVHGKPVAFRQAKCKELLAYLIDRNGASVTRREAFAILWEDRMYDRPMQKQLDTIIRLLRTTLIQEGIGEIFEMKSAALRINPDLISCDAWRYLEGDPDARRAYRGEYMSNYSWALFTERCMTEMNT
ncbi:MAG: response regulator [Clostridia bacterium]|nr:response regulator [Clostridia bacterium]